MGIFGSGGFLSGLQSRTESPIADLLANALPAMLGGLVMRRGEDMGLGAGTRLMGGLTGPLMSRIGGRLREGRQRVEEDITADDPSQGQRNTLVHDLLSGNIPGFEHLSQADLEQMAYGSEMPQLYRDIGEQNRVRGEQQGRAEESVGDIRSTSGESYERARERTDSPVVSQSEIDMMAAEQRNEINRSMGDIAERRGDEAAAMGQSGDAIRASMQDLEGQSILAQTQGKLGATLTAADINRAGQQAFGAAEIQAADAYMNQLIPQQNRAADLLMPQTFPSEAMLLNQEMGLRDFERREAAEQGITAYQQGTANVLGGIFNDRLNANTMEDQMSKAGGGSGLSALIGGGTSAIPGALLGGVLALPTGGLSVPVGAMLGAAGGGVYGAGQGYLSSQGGGGGGGGGGGANPFGNLLTIAAMSQMGGQGGGGLFGQAGATPTGPYQDWGGGYNMMDPAIPPLDMAGPAGGGGMLPYGY